MDWNDVLNIRKARELMHPDNTSDNPEPYKNRGINSPVLNDTEQLVFRMRAELIDYIVAHGLVDGLIWDGVIKKTENGKIVITAEMVDSLVDKLQFFKKEDVLKLLETYLPENNYVKDENYVHTDNNFTDEEIARIDKAISDIIEVKEHEQECDEENRRKFEEIDGRLSWHDANLITISSQIAAITSSTIRQQAEIDEIEKVVGNHLKDYEMHLQDFNDHLEEAAEKFNGIGEEMNSFREDLTDLENREKVNEQNIASLIAADADINRHMREIDDNHRKLTASTILLASEIHRVEDKVDKNERNNQIEHEELRNRIQEEYDRAVAKESEIENKISGLTASSIVTDAKITALSEALAEETKRATDAENALGDRIDRVTASSLIISGQISEIEEAIKRESEERKAADNDIKSSMATMSSTMAVLSSSVLVNSSKIESIKEVINSTGTEIGAINARLDAAEDSISANTTVIQDHGERINRLEELARGGATIYALSTSPIKVDLISIINSAHIPEVSHGLAKITMNIKRGNVNEAKVDIRTYYSIGDILAKEVIGEIGTVEGFITEDYGLNGIVFGKAMTTDIDGEIELLCSVITDESWSAIPDVDISTEALKASVDGLSSVKFDLDSFGGIDEPSDGYYFVNGFILIDFIEGQNIAADEAIRVFGTMRKVNGTVTDISLMGCGDFYGSTVTVSKTRSDVDVEDISVIVTTYADSCVIVETATESFFKAKEEDSISYVKFNQYELPESINNAIYRQMGSDEVATLGIRFILYNDISNKEIRCYVQGTVISVQSSDAKKGHLVGELTGADESVKNKSDKIMSLNVTMHGDETGMSTLMNISAIVYDIMGDSFASIKDFEVLKLYVQYKPIRISKKGPTVSDELINNIQSRFIFPGQNEVFIYYANLVIQFNIVDTESGLIGSDIRANVNGLIKIQGLNDPTKMSTTASFVTRTDMYSIDVQNARTHGRRDTTIIYSQVELEDNVDKNARTLLEKLFLDLCVISDGDGMYAIEKFIVLLADFYKIN